MSSKRRQRRVFMNRSCKDKIKHATKDEAKEAAGKLLYFRGDYTEPYYCLFCCSWHNGHPPRHPTETQKKLVKIANNTEVVKAQKAHEREQAILAKKEAERLRQLKSPEVKKAEAEKQQRREDAEYEARFAREQMGRWADDGGPTINEIAIRKYLQNQELGIKKGHYYNIATQYLE